MASLQADEFEAEVDSVDLDIIDAAGTCRKNWTLIFKDEENLRPHTIAEEKRRFLEHFPHSKPPMNFIWVIVNKESGETPMDDNRRAISYQKALQNSHIETRVAPA